MKKFTENQLEQAIIELLAQENIPHLHGGDIVRKSDEVLMLDVFREFLQKSYRLQGITDSEINSIIRKLESYADSDLYESNKAIMELICNGFLLKREDPTQKDIYIYLIDYQDIENNQFHIVNQLEVIGYEKRIPDGILYINGLPLVVFEFKSAIREQASIYDAYVQLTTRYRRDIPKLFKYNAFCVISDGVNNKKGSLFAPYEFYYAWRKVTGDEMVDKDGIDSLFTMVHGLFNKQRLLSVIKNFIYFPDTAKNEEKIVCRYPQYYATTKLYQHILQEQKPQGSGKGGVYFGATGCGKSFTMLFLTRMLMRSSELESPTIVLITDRTDLDDQLSTQFTNAKTYIGDQNIISVESRAELRELLQNRASGGVFLTTIHKFTEDIQLLSERTNIICISDEAHRSQTNLDQKITITDEGVKRSYGFAKYLHNSLPNATYVGFTGTPIDATLDVFGQIVDAYTMNESVRDEITVRLVYEGRSAKVILDNSKLKEIEEYYKQCEEAGASDYAIDESKKASAKMNVILGDPDRIKAIAEDFVNHYETRVREGSTLKGKAMFVCSSRQIAYDLYKQIIILRPDWEIEQIGEKICADNETLSEQEEQEHIQAEIKAMPRVKLIATRSKDDELALYEMLGTKEYRKELDRQFKNAKSNFKIAIVVDMWLTGFDVPFLDTIYIDKPLQKHNLIQTISRVNRKFEGKDKGLIVDYIGIKKAMNQALKQYNHNDNDNIEDISHSVTVVKDHLELLAKLFHTFDSSDYFKGSSLEKLQCLNRGAEFIQHTQESEKRFMFLVKRLKTAYDICCGSDAFSEHERDTVHFYLAIRSIIFKLTKGNAPDTAQMNKRVREMMSEALKADGVEEIIKIGEQAESEIDLFSDDYLAKLEKIKLPHTKIKLLQQLLAKAIGNFKKVNKVQAVNFSKKLTQLVERYNERKEDDVLVSEVLDEFSDEIINLYHQLTAEMNSFTDMGIDFEEKAFYDILLSLTEKYDFTYPDEKLIELAKEVKIVVEDKAKYTNWLQQDNIKAELQVDLILLLDKYGYPPVDRDEVYKEILEQAENYKRNADNI